MLTAATVPPTARLVLASWFKYPLLSLLLAPNLKGRAAKRAGANSPIGQIRVGDHIQDI